MSVIFLGIAVAASASTKERHAMSVQDVMQTTLYTVTSATTLLDALVLTNQRGIRHLPVLERDRLRSGFAATALAARLSAVAAPRRVG